MSPPPGDTRLSAEARRAQIVDAADILLSELGYLPLPIALLSERAGISRALIYARFVSQYDIVNEVLNRHLELLIDAGVDDAMAMADLASAAEHGALIYLAHIAKVGAALHVGFRESYMIGHFDRKILRLRDRTFRPLARLVRREMKLSVVDTIAAIQMMLTIPEEAGRLVFEGEIKLDQAEVLCRRLLKSSIDALRPNGAA